MDTLSELKAKKKQQLDMISEYAKKGDADNVIKSSEILERVNSLISRFETLNKEISELQITDHVQRQDPEFKNELKEKKITRKSRSAKYSARARGKNIREEFIKKIEKDGIMLQELSATIFKNSSGKRIGIAVATERIADRWFLGLSKGAFDHAVLLCQREEADVIEICLPDSFFKQYENHLSMSGGQIKFNVVRRGTGYYLRIPGTDGVKMSDYMNDCSVLR